MKEAIIRINKYEPYKYCWFRDAEIKHEECEPVLEYISFFDSMSGDDIELDVARVDMSNCISEFVEDPGNNAIYYILWGVIGVNISDITEGQKKELEEEDYKVDYGFSFVKKDDIDVEAEREFDWDFHSNYSVDLEM